MVSLCILPVCVCVCIWMLKREKNPNISARKTLSYQEESFSSRSFFPWRKVPWKKCLFQLPLDAWIQSRSAFDTVTLAPKLVPVVISQLHCWSSDLTISPALCVPFLFQHACFAFDSLLRTTLSVRFSSEHQTWTATVRNEWTMERTHLITEQIPFHAHCQRLWGRILLPALAWNEVTFIPCYVTDPYLVLLDWGNFFPWGENKFSQTLASVVNFLREGS